MAIGWMVHSPTQEAPLRYCSYPWLTIIDMQKIRMSVKRPFIGCFEYRSWDARHLAATQYNLRNSVFCKLWINFGVRYEITCGWNAFLVDTGHNRVGCLKRCSLNTRLTQRMWNAVSSLLQSWLRLRASTHSKTRVYLHSAKWSMAWTHEYIDINESLLLHTRTHGPYQLLSSFWFIEP